MDKISLEEIRTKYKNEGQNNISKYILQILKQESIIREIRNTMVKNITLEEFETNPQWYVDIIWEYLSTLPQAQVGKYTMDDIELNTNNTMQEFNPIQSIYMVKDSAYEIQLRGKGMLEKHTFEKNYDNKTIELDKRVQYIRKVIEANLAEVQYKLMTELDLAIYRKMQEGYTLTNLALTPGIDIIGEKIPPARKVLGLRTSKG